MKSSLIESTQNSFSLLNRALIFDWPHILLEDRLPLRTRQQEGNSTLQRRRWHRLVAPKGHQGNLCKIRSHKLRGQLEWWPDQQKRLNKQLFLINQRKNVKQEHAKESFETFRCSLIEFFPQFSFSDPIHLGMPSPFIKTNQKNNKNLFFSFSWEFGGDETSKRTLMKEFGCFQWDCWKNREKHKNKRKNGKVGVNHQYNLKPFLLDQFHPEKWVSSNENLDFGSTDDRLSEFIIELIVSTLNICDLETDQFDQYFPFFQESNQVNCCPSREKKTWKQEKRWKKN